MDIEELRSRYKSGERDFAGIRLRGKTINIRLDGADFRGADLSECIIPRSFFNKADLSRANLSGIYIDNGLFNCNLTGANLQDGIGLGFVNCNMKGANLNNFKFLDDESGIASCVIDEASLKGTIFPEYLVISNTSLRNTNWKDVLGGELGMDNVDLTGASIHQSSEVLSPSFSLSNVTLANGQHIEGYLVGVDIRDLMGVTVKEVERMKRVI